MQEKYGYGNAQTIGSYEIQSNYFSVQSTDTIFAVLADGNMDHRNGRNAAILAVETSLKEFARKPAHLSMQEFFDFLVMQMIRNMNDHIYLGIKPNVSVCIAYIEGETLYYFTVGDNQICLTDGFHYTQLKEQNGTCKIKRTELLVMMSKGVYEAFHEVELLSYLSKTLDPYEKAQQIIQRVNEKNIKMAKNATIILIEGN